MITGLFLGLLFGFVLQRGRFCIASIFRHFSFRTTKSNPLLTALLLAVSLQSIALFLLQDNGFLTVPIDRLPIAATLMGAFLFGCGMIFAGGCATGSWYRSGEGLIGSCCAVLLFALSMAAAQSGFLRHWIRPLLENRSDYDNIYRTLHISPWVLVSVLSAVTALLIYRQYRRPAMPIAMLPARRSGLSHLLFEKHWHPLLSGTLIAAIAIAAWLLSIPTGRNFGLGISVPSANVVQYVVSGQSRYLNWGTCLVLGIPLGAFIAAKLSGEFRWRVPSAETFGKSAVGGILMGVGAALSGGCTIANSLVATAYFSWQGWLATIMMLFGAWCASFVMFKRYA
ncbi:hypothetical protein A1D23_11565 [Chelonobacter oris]|uniref:Uncharacterized protein n=1 Tax=Chelonobacter oris TaxID=505317 RepID=A0A0A3ARA4_9PAST|nr:hypothetical protein OA57_10915 [Chelonobacter oris]MDH3001090.1 hypothetical protein [Chelonobacter oris]